MFHYQKTWLKTIGIVAMLVVVLGSAIPAAAQAHPAPQYQSNPVQGSPLVYSETAMAESENRQNAQNALDSSWTDSAVLLGNTEPIDCRNPLPGVKNRLVADNEILVGFRDDDNWVQMVKLDNRGQDDPGLDFKFKWWNQHNDRDDISWQSITAVDLDADGKDEVVSAFRDADKTLQVVSLKNAECNNCTPDFAHWWSTAHGRKGGNLSKIDIASGNLTREENGSEEVVVAFRDAGKDLQLVVLDGKSDGGLTFLAEWWSTSHARGNVKNVSVAVGDLDGDGYDDEIVVAIEDGDDDLQVIVLEWDGDSWLSEKHWDYWTKNNRGDIIEYNNPQGIDVAVGDVDGDYKDEIAIAFQEKNDALQILVLEDAAEEYKERGSWTDPAHARNDVWYVAVTMGDIDGDGRAEIAAAFQDNDDNFHLVALDAQDGKPQLRGSYWSTSDQRDNVSWMSIDAGDIDGDGRAEIATAFRDSGHDLQVITFDGEKDNSGNAFHDGDAARDNGDGIAWRKRWEDHGNGRGDVKYVGIAMGDADGNTSFAIAQDTCEEIEEAHVTAVVTVPPYWEDVNQDGSAAGYGKSHTDSTQEGKSTSKTFSSSTTLNLTPTFGPNSMWQAGASFTYEYQSELTHSWTHGTSKTVENGFVSDPSVDVYDMVIYDAVQYYCYQYKNSSDDALQRVCVPVSVSEEAKAVEWWNQASDSGITDGGRTQNQKSWIPAERTAWSDRLRVAPGQWMGSSNQDAGAAIAKINAGDTPDLVWAWIDNPSGENLIHYRIGWDMQSNGQVGSWSNHYKASDRTIGSESAGLGVAIANLDTNPKPDLIVAWVDNPAQSNYAYYRIGWNLGTNGVAASWTESALQIPGSLGWETQGAGLGVFNLNGGTRPDLVFGWIDNPSDTNAAYYKVGWDLDPATGKAASWSTEEISGAFGVEDTGLGIAIADMDGSGGPELIAGWVRAQDEADRLQYAIGYNLNAQGKVEYWAPGQPFPGPVSHETSGAAFAAADLDGDGQNEWFFGWIDNPSGENAGYYRTGQLWDISGEVDRRPTDVRKVDEVDDYFQIKLEDQWWNVSGSLLWIKDGAAQNVGPGSTATHWSVTEATFGSQSEEKSSSHTFSVGGEASYMGMGVENTESWGFSNGSSYEISWEDTFYMEGQAGGMRSTADPALQYSYKPFSYMQSGFSLTGVEQEYMAVDYIVPSRASQSRLDIAPAAVQEIQGDPPAAPFITSPTHVAGVWGAADDASFTWGQAIPDPTIAGYRWLLDTTADTTPSPLNLGMDTQTTYENLADGTYYFHVRAMNAGGAWSETTHFELKIDANAPQGQIVFDPSAPNGVGWYNTPVTLTLQTDDGNGSGVQAVTYSNNGGLTWQPYTNPTVLAADTNGTSYQFRMTDMTGKTGMVDSGPIYIDLTAPATPTSTDIGCWSSGACSAKIGTNAQGNQVLQLTGQAVDLLSGVRGVEIQINDGSWMVASQVLNGEWALELLNELGAGYHTVNIRAEDAAGNTESNHFFAQVLWLPRSAPDLSASTFYASAAKARPGDCVDFTVDIRNQAWQESQVAATVQAPAGFEVQVDSISDEGQYHPENATITWLLDYLWPGQRSAIDFQACVSQASAAQQLVVGLQLKSQWPNVDQLPAEQQAIFKAMETSEERSVTVQVDPNFPAGWDLTLPHAFLALELGQFTSAREIQLKVEADEVVRFVFVREWVWSAAAQAWQVDHESQWLPYQPTLDWQLANQEGVHYLGVWIVDEAGNVSQLSDASLKLTNLVTDSATLGAGQNVQYRFVSQPGDWIGVTVQALSGNLDLFAWLPNNGYFSDLSSVGLGDVDSISLPALDIGMFLYEVQADVDSAYRLMVSGDLFGRGEEGVLELDQGQQSLVAASDLPVHPLDITDPFSVPTTLAPPGLSGFSVFLPAVLR